MFDVTGKTQFDSRWGRPLDRAHKPQRFLAVTFALSLVLGLAIGCSMNGGKPKPSRPADLSQDLVGAVGRVVKRATSAVVAEPSATATALPSATLTALPSATSTLLPSATPTAVPSDTPAPPPEDSSTQVSVATPARAPESTPTLVPAEASPPPDAVVNVDRLNFRTGPGLSYDVQRVLEQGTELTVMGKSPDGEWLAVTDGDGREGWVYATMVDLSPSLGKVAIAQDIPPTPTPKPTVKAVEVLAPASQPAPTTREAPPAAPPPMPPPIPADAVPAINPLTGLATGREALTHRPILARIGNDQVARPQAGLSQADVVYEDIMEGWAVTRLTAVFLSQSPPMIRPIRSARLVSIELTPQFQGALAHSGASDEIRFRISQSPFIDLDEFYNMEPYSYGDGDWRTRLYTTGPALRSYLAAKGWDEPVAITGWAFADTPPEGAPASQIYFPYPRVSDVTWHYDDSIGLYRRWVHGLAHTDANNGQQITAANVVALYTVHAKTDIVEDSLGSTAIDIRLMGEGPIKVFRDGLMLEGVWRRGDTFQLTRFYFPDGREIPLKPGVTWVQLVPQFRPEYHPTVN